MALDPAPQANGFEPPHHPVLYQQIINALSPTSPGRYIDATIGAGGHAWGILNASRPEGQLLGVDLDPQALELAEKRLAEFNGNAILIQGSYVTIKEQVRNLGWENVQGIVIDLGVSSMQIDTPERGFSFQSDGPLDMRFGPSQPMTAADILNQWTEREIADLLWRYGEERQSRRIARTIVQNRPVHTTHELADLVAKSVGGRKGPTHPATRTFQALRIAVNQELENIEEFLPRAVEILSEGGKLAVISFHSLEDRIVKQFFRKESRDCICPPEQPVCTCDHRASIVEVNRHPIEATEDEKQVNPRARSARLRIAEKITSDLEKRTGM